MTSNCNDGPASLEALRSTGLVLLRACPSGETSVRKRRTGTPIHRAQGTSPRRTRGRPERPGGRRFRGRRAAACATVRTRQREKRARRRSNPDPRSRPLGREFASTIETPGFATKPVRSSRSEAVSSLSKDARRRNRVAPVPDYCGGDAQGHVSVTCVNPIRCRIGRLVGRASTMRYRTPVAAASCARAATTAR